MNTLSIFIDESGDFGESDTPYYLVSMVFHSQNDSLHKEIEKLNESLQTCEYVDKCIHTAPIIRRENPYHNLTIDERRKILYKLRSFIIACKISQHTFIAQKKNIKTKMELSSVLTKYMKEFIQNKLEYFLSFEKVIIYYDNGQSELSSILKSIFQDCLANVEFRLTNPKNYKLSQVADFVCTIELLKLKYDNKCLSKSEQSFFYKPQELKKSFIKIVVNMRI